MVDEKGTFSRRVFYSVVFIVAAIALVFGSMFLTKKTMFATSYISTSPQDALDKDGNITLCPGQTPGDMDGTTVGTSSSPVLRVTIGHPLSKTYDFPAVRTCWNGTTDCVAPGGATTKKCGGRLGSTEVVLEGPQYGTAFTHVQQDNSVAKYGYFGPNSGGIPAKALRANLTSAPNAFLGECLTIEEGGERHFAKAADVTPANCPPSKECAKYCVYNISLE